MTEQVFVPISAEQFNGSVHVFKHRPLPSTRDEQGRIVVLYHRNGHPESIILRKIIATGINNVIYEADAEVVRRNLDKTFKKLQKNSHHGAHLDPGNIYLLPQSDLVKEKVTTTPD